MCSGHMVSASTVVKAKAEESCQGTVPPHLLDKVTHRLASKFLSIPRKFLSRGPGLLNDNSRRDEAK